jgi:APA family basic amino acid/polyamine antiporter
MASPLFRTKPLSLLLEEMAGENRLRRILGPAQLTALGVGAIIGTGIFILTGVAAHDRTGPALMLSFVLAGLACVFAALCYAEFASMVPVAGSAYTYAYATLGELLAWIIGWDLILEYAMSCATVAASWSKYFNEFLRVCFGPDWVVPSRWCHDPFSQANAVMNLPAVLILLPAVTAAGPAGVLAALIGVNVGPNATYVGSLATLLWRRIVRQRAVDATQAEFLRLGALTVPAGLLLATVALWATTR